MLIVIPVFVLGGSSNIANTIASLGEIGIEKKDLETANTAETETIDEFLGEIDVDIDLDLGDDLNSEVGYDNTENDSQDLFAETTDGIDDIITGLDKMKDTDLDFDEIGF